MKIRRLRLRNWRGVEDRTVEFAATGVTVVEGPNEIGKSSLVEALDLLFDELDSSSKARVRATKPVHADVGAEVEAEVESGAYDFVYAKRFHKKAQTTLTVRAPRAESVTGREAHERADAILRETLDVDLWRALRVAQGSGLEQAELAGKPWLTAALDRAAGGARDTGDAAEALFDRIGAEYEIWWTERGPRKPVTDADQRLAAAEADVARLRADLAKLEADVERTAALAKEVARLEASCADLERRAAERAAAAAALAGLRAARDDAEKRLAQADAVRERSHRARTDRVNAVRELAAVESAAAAAEAALSDASPELDAARAALADAERALADAESADDLARREAELREHDFEFRRDELDLAQLGERRARLETAEREAAAAEEVVARVRADDAALAKLRGLHEDVVKAQVRLEAAGAAVRVEALGACAPEIDGVATPLDAGASRDVRVVGSWKLEMPGVVRVEVRSGAGTDAPRADFEARRRAFDDALAAARVATLDEAVAANAALREARRALGDRDRLAKENLRDLTREELVRKIENLRPRVAGYVAQRPAEPALPANYDAAHEARRASKVAATAAAAAVVAARTRRDAARARADRSVASSHEGEVRVRVLRERAVEVRRLLDGHRAAAPDDALERALDDAESASAGVAAEAKAAREALAAAQPDVVEELARSARTAADRARDDRHRAERELDALRATLAVRGEEGLSEKLGAAECARDAAQSEAARKHAQADAAKVLFEAMSAERDAARALYVAPFRAKVESLGRTVFGPDFAVGIDDDLRIVSRTLGGRTVEFESLSGGAREQIGVIARIACALLAAEEGGVPVVLDDAFGWSDPDRLERMGALLAVAGRSCQVILLTCDPARHRHIPGASVVRLA